MRDPLFDLLVIGALVGLNAWLAGSEIAFVSLRQGQIERLAKEGGRGRRVADLARNPNRFFAGIQLGITLAGFLAAAVAAVSISEPLADALPIGEFAPLVALAVVTVGVAMLNLILGELVPKRIAMQRAQRWSLSVVRPLSAFIALIHPLIVMSGWITDKLVKLFGGDPRASRAAITDDEFIELARSLPTFSETQRRVIEGAVLAGQRPVRAVMVPRARVVSVDIDSPIESAIDDLVATGFSKAPVVNRQLDELVGQVRLTDLVRAEGVLADHVHPLVAIPETSSVLRALRRLQSNRTELAAVIDEHGGTAGIVTAEDLVEELVGEIYDETDVATLAHREDDGSLVVPGSFAIHDLATMGIEVEPGPYDTVAGLVLHRLGHVPTVGERVDVDGFAAEVLAMERHVIGSIRVTRDEPNGSGASVSGSIGERSDQTAH